MYLQHTQYWVVVFQPRAEAIEPLGYAPIGVKFATLYPPIHPYLSSSSGPYASSGIPDAASS